MEEVKIEYFKYLPTEERRQAAKRLKKYIRRTTVRFRRCPPKGAERNRRNS